jgi:hypothetical protein
MNSSTRERIANHARIESWYSRGYKPLNQPPNTTTWFDVFELGALLGTLAAIAFYSLV